MTLREAALFRAMLCIFLLCTFLTGSYTFAELLSRVINVTSLVDTSDGVSERRLYCDQKLDWASELSRVFSSQNHSLQYQEIMTSGRQNLTRATDQAIYIDASHVLLVEGSEETAKVVGVVASTSQVPVIAIPPRHSWSREGHKLSNVLVPRYGQSQKGLAVIDLIKPPAGVSVEFAAVWREDKASPELETALQAHKSATGLHLQQLYVSSGSLSIGEAIDIKNQDSYFDAFIVDCSLDLFEQLIPLFLYERESPVIHRQLVIVFLHQFYEVVNWPGLFELSTHTSYIFAFRQGIPLDQNGIRSNYSTYDAIKYDSLKAVATVANRNDLDLTSWTYIPIETEHGVAFTVAALNDGLKLVAGLHDECFKGLSGHMGFTTGNQLLPDCLDKSTIFFDVMQLNTSRKLSHGNISCQLNWDAVGSWSAIGGLQMETELWSLTKQTESGTLRLRVIVVPFGQFSYPQNNRTKWNGIDIDLLSFIVSQEEFKVNISDIEFIQWNGSRDTITEELTATNYKYHMVIGGIPIKPGRQHYSHTYFTGSLAILQRISHNGDSNLWGFLLPFKWTVWLISLTLILLSGIVCKWLGLCDGYSQGLWLACCSVFFLQENRLSVMQNYWGRIFMVNYAVFILILTSTYTANLVSFLSPSSSSTTVSLRDFVNVPVITLSSSPYLELLRQGTALQNLRTADNIPGAIESLRNGSVDAFLAETSLLVHIVNSDGNCALSVVRSGLFTQQIAFALSDEFALAHGEKVNIAIQAALADGIVLKSLRRYLTLNTDGYKCTESLNYAESLDDSSNRFEEDTVETPLNYGSMGGIFIIVAVGGVTTLTAKAIQCSWRRFRYGKWVNSIRHTN